MKSLPPSPDLSHLKKQAKRLLKAAKAVDAEALRRVLQTLPAVRNLDAAALADRELRLHDTQSVIAREYGFNSWTELKRYVDWKQDDRAVRLASWMRIVIEGHASRRKLAVRLLREEPELFAGDPWLACAIGDEAAVREAIARIPGFVSKSGGPFDMPPLIAVTLSKLLLDDGFDEGLLACARLLLEHGADANLRWSDPHYPGSSLSALYGAAGVTHHAGMTKLLLDAGADPNDNESLYHSVETADLTCTRLLLESGARVTGTNALGRVLDYDRLDGLKLLLDHGGDPNENTWIHHAIMRGRSTVHIRTLLRAGGDPNARNHADESVSTSAFEYGRMDVVKLLHDIGIDEDFSAIDCFMAACSSGDEAAAREFLDNDPDLVSSLGERQLTLLPRLASIGRYDAVRLMLELGWPREVKWDWQATALNLAAFRGDAKMVRLLMEHGADWTTQHGYGDNVIGTLSFASLADEIADPAPMDYAGCACALVENGVPRASFERGLFSPEVMEYLETANSA